MFVAKKKADKLMSALSYIETGGVTFPTSPTGATAARSVLCFYADSLFYLQEDYTINYSCCQGG